jgi:hypothetical protein
VCVCVCMCVCERERALETWQNDVLVDLPAKSGVFKGRMEQAGHSNRK